jgi:hypothetical protein
VKTADACNVGTAGGLSETSLIDSRYEVWYNTPVKCASIGISVMVLLVLSFLPSMGWQKAPRVKVNRMSEEERR